MSQTPKLTQQQDQMKAGLVGKSQHQFIKLAKEAPKSNQNRPVDLEQLQAYDTAEEAWTSLDGVVYDVTSYLKHHPGGKDMLLKGCGKQCDELFYKYHPWVNAKYLLDKFKIGHLRK